MRFLSITEYNAILLRTLRRCGLDDDAARRLIAARWPMTIRAFLLELDARGLRVDPAAAREWVVEILGAEKWPDGVRVQIDEVFVSESLAEKFVQWVVCNGKAQPSTVGRLLQADPKPAKMLLHLAAAPEN